MEHIKRKLALLSLLFSLIVMLMFFVQPVKADNHDVLDQANVIDAETQRISLAKLRDIPKLR